jgi:PAS domain S-box-containing protein
MKPKEDKAYAVRREIKFRVLSEFSPIGIFVSNPEGVCVYVNPRACEIIGITLGEARDCGWQSRVHAEDQKRVIGAWTKMLIRKKEFREEFRFRRMDASERIVRGHAREFVDTENKRTGFVGTLEDVTEERVAHARLEENEARLQKLTQSAPVGIIMVGENLKVSFMNAEAERITGYTLGEMKSKKWFDVLPVKEVPRVLAIGAKAMMKHISFEVDFPIKRRDGEVRTIRTRATVIRNESRQDKQYVGFIVDMTDELLAKKEMSRKTEELANINRFMMNREVKMAELKTEIVRLKKLLAAK